MKILRIENASGMGPYSGSSSSKEMFAVKHVLSGHNLKPRKYPTVGRDCFGNPRNMSPDYYCGFSSFRSYRSWFSGVLKKLAKAGKKQVAFLKKEAKLVKKLSPLAKESEIQAVLAA